MKKVLIVEDEIITAFHLKLHLSKLDFSVLPPVTSGEKAVEVSKNEKPDIILMDINLASTMNGIQAANEILTHYNPFIMFMTGSNDAAYVEQVNCMKAPLLNKPYTMNEVISPIKKKFNPTF